MTSEKLLYRITDINSDNSLYRGLTYYKNYVYATNGAAFAKIKYDFDKSYKGKTFLCDGTSYEMNKKEFAFINSKLDDYIKNKERDTIDISRVSDMLNPIMQLNDYLTESISYIRFGDNLYNIKLLKEVLCIAYELFLFNGGLSKVNNINALIIKDSDNLIMCACSSKSIDEVAYIDYKSNKLKNFNYGDFFRNIKTDLSKLNKDKKKTKTSKDEKTIDKQISLLNNYRDIVDGFLK